MKKIILFTTMMFCFLTVTYSQIHTFRNVYIPYKGMSDVTISKTNDGNYQLSFSEAGWPTSYWVYIVKFNKFENNLYIYDHVSKQSIFDPDLSSGEGWTPHGLLSPTKLSETATGKGAKIKMNMLDLSDMKLYDVTFECK